MPSFAALFPLLADGLPPQAREVEFQPDHWHHVRLVWELCDRRLEAAGSLAERDRVAVLLLEELHNAGERLDQAAQPVLEHAGLLVGTQVAHSAFHAGDIGRPHEWLLRALGEQYAGNADYEAHPRRLLLYREHPHPQMRADAAELAAVWLLTLFSHAWRSGDHQGLASVYFDLSKDLLADGSFLALLPSEGSLLVELSIQRAQWAMYYRPEEAQDAAAPLLRILQEPTLPPALGPRIELFLSCTRVQVGDVPRHERAQTALERHRDQYLPRERLELLLSTAAGRAENIQGIFDELTDVLAEIRTEVVADGPAPSEVKLRTGQSFQVLGPALRALAEDGQVTSAIALLAAWQGVEVPPEVLRDEALLAVPAHPVGTLWAVQGSSAPAADDERNDLGRVIDAVNAFLNMTILFRDDPDFTLRQPARPAGVPMPDHGEAFVDVCLAHLRFDGLNALERPPGPMVVAPGQPIPFQALMVRELGWTLPICVSLQRPVDAPHPRHAVLMGDGQTTTSTWELDGVAAFLADAGIHVTRVPSTTASFTEAYEDATVDILWVASHAAFEAMQPERSVLHLAPGEEIGLDDLCALAIPERTGARLLTLSTCDAGMSAALGGLLGFGLGPAVAGPRQAVISHLWSTYPQPAAAFGVTLGAELAGGADYSAAFCKATQVLSGGRASVVSTLSGLGEAVARLREHIELTTLPYENVACWGSPALFV